MKKSIYIISVAGLLIGSLLLIGNVSAFGRGPCQGFGGLQEGHSPMMGMPFKSPMGRLFRMAEKLELSKEQRDQIWNIMDENRREMRVYMESLYEGRKEMRRIGSSATYDELEARKLAEAQGKTLAEVIYLKLQVKNRIKSILTAEQQAKFAEMRGKSLKN